MRRIILLAGAILLAATGSHAQDTPVAEVSASYSFLRFGVSNGVNQNGASISVAGNLNHWLGLAGAYSAEGGLDLGLNRRVAVRPQLDYMGARFSGTNINTIRASIGIVFRFGNR
jgi:hypothetical protein